MINKGEKFMRKGKELDTIKNNDLQCEEAVGWKDILAIIIAQFQILMPIMLGAALIMSLVLFIIAFSIFWFNLGGWLAIAPTSTLDMYGTKHYSQNYGVVFTAYGIGAIIGVLSSGAIMDILQSYNSIFYFVIGLCITGILLSQRMIK